MPDADLLRRWSTPALIILLAAAWLLGGATVDTTSLDEGLILLSIPAFALGASVLWLEGVEGRLQQAAIIVAALVVLVPLVQLLPLPQGWWNSAPDRRTLGADLAAAGVAAMQARWSLARGATEAGLWALLPAVAGFLLALVLPQQRRRIAIKAILLLVLGNVVVAFFQAGLPRDSALRLYQASGFGGLLANTNHQATALIIGMVLAVGQAAHARHLQQAGRARPHAWIQYAALAGFCFLLVPLSGSRAGMVLALPSLAAGLILCGALPLRRMGRNKGSAALGLAALALAAIGIHAAMGWMAVDEADELRHVMAGAAWSIGWREAPWGSGIGSFVQVFEQHAPSSLWLAAYVNHAHNEYVQWWLVAGWLGMLAMAAVVGLLVVAAVRIVRRRARNGHSIQAASCLVAICAVLAHSWADYPLRTTTLMTTTAVLAGLMFAALADMRAGAEDRRKMRRQRTGQGHSPA